MPKHQKRIQYIQLNYKLIPIIGEVFIYIICYTYYFKTEIYAIKINKDKYRTIVKKPKIV